MQWQSCVLISFLLDTLAVTMGLSWLFWITSFVLQEYIIFRLAISVIDQACSFKMADYYRADIKNQGPGISPAYYECGPRLRI